MNRSHQKPLALHWTQGSLLAQGNVILHGMTTRGGGVSTEPYGSLNLGLHVGDDLENVLENRRRAAQDLGFNLDDWVSGEQVHGNKVLVATKSERSRGAFAYSESLPGVDGLVTDEPGVLLAAFFADCVPLFFHDPCGPRIGIGHAGWRGTLADIAGAVVRRMVETYGTDPRSLFAWVGPSIGPCCFAVSPDVANQFGSILGDASFAQYQEKPHLDLPNINRHLLIRSRVPASQIEMSGLCTMCNTHQFFSHRACGPKTGRMAGLIGIPAADGRTPRR